jgi:hypothetical protein
MAIKKSLVAFGVGILLLSGSTTPPLSSQAWAQSCPELYGAMMQSGPGSSQYNQIYNEYQKRCSGRSDHRGDGRGTEREGHRDRGSEREVRDPRRVQCEELRQACLRKDQLGEQGEGNCRRYRQTCRQ